ncbi:MAG: MOSC domain-containing protein [Bacteroidetes bacterium]|nr:MAG: MOSC domain-containing protein [Bacteroidota bacterium]
MKITRLFIYPIKSLGGVSLSTSAVDQRGLRYDRRYMLVDEKGNFLSQRQMPELCLFKVELMDNGFLVTYLHNKLLIPFSMEGATNQVVIWEDEVEAIIASDSYNQWFSACLGSAVRLVFMGQLSKRAVNKDYALNGEEVSFADGYPILLLSEASLTLLNGKLTHAIDVDRFRPNVVITGCEAHEEGSFSVFKAGDSLLKRVKPCARCVVTTIDPLTGEAGKEPLYTLAKYRMEGNKIMFGENVLCLQEGQVSVGDDLVLLL